MGRRGQVVGRGGLVARRSQVVGQRGLTPRRGQVAVRRGLVARRGEVVGRRGLVARRSEVVGRRELVVRCERVAGRRGQVALELRQPDVEFGVVRVRQLGVHDLVSEVGEAGGQPVLPVALGSVVLPAVEDQEGGGHGVIIPSVEMAGPVLSSLVESVGGGAEVNVPRGRGVTVVTSRPYGGDVPL